MREATRRQVFGLGAGAIGVMAAAGSVEAVADHRPNDARLLELEKRHRVALDHSEDFDETGMDPGEANAELDRRWEYVSAALDEARETTPDSGVGAAAKWRMLREHFVASVGGPGWLDPLDTSLLNAGDELVMMKDA